MRLTTKLAALACFAVNTLFIGCGPEHVKVHSKKLDIMANNVHRRLADGPSPMDVDSALAVASKEYGCKITEGPARSFLEDHMPEQHVINVWQQNKTRDTMRVGKSVFFQPSLKDAKKPWDANKGWSPW
jgi:hypothetical protein